MNKMIYKDYIFETNPEKISITFSSLLNKKDTIDDCEVVGKICEKARLIKGEGKFFINECAKNILNLQILQKEEKSGWLFLPNSEPILCFFQEFQTEFDAKKNAIKYKFSFVEDLKSKKTFYEFGFTYALKDENAFDVANRTDVGVDVIMELNKFKSPFDIAEGEKVILR